MSYKYVLLNDDNSISCCWLHRLLFWLIVPFYLFTNFYMISVIHLANRVTYIYRMRLLAHIHNPYDLLIIPNKDSNIFIIIFTDVYCQMAHLRLSVFFSFSFYTYKDQSKFIFKTSRQQAISIVASFFHHHQFFLYT